MAATTTSLFDYSRPLRLDEASVLLASCDPEVDLGPIVRTVRSAGAKYGFTVAESSGSLSNVVPTGTHTIRHLIFLSPINELHPDDCTLSILAEILNRFTSISIALRYPTGVGLTVAGPLVTASRDRFGDRINFILPDVVDPTGCRVSAVKIAENATCDTVRIKYFPHRIESDVVKVPAHVERFFRSASKAFAELHLFHRWPTDGYIAYRGDVAPSEFYVTATKTDKVGLDLTRVVLVHKYDVASNQLTYSGPFLPSSDAVEAAMVFEACRDVGALVHTHASTRFTRNPAFRHRVTAMNGVYGEPTVGRSLISALENTSDGLVIMEDHGEVFALRRPTDDGVDFGERVLSLERRARWATHSS